jgi:hypothetical protein
LKTQAEKIAAWALEGKQSDRIECLMQLHEELERIINTIRVRRARGKDVADLEEEVESLLRCFIDGRIVAERS